MGITNIKLYENKTDKMVFISKREDHNDNITLKAHSSGKEEIWAPWVTNENEFKNKVMIVDVRGDRTYYVYQNGNRVRYTTSDAYQDPGDAIPGDSQVDGDRRMIISNDGIELEAI